MNAGRINVEDLCMAEVLDTENPVAGRLGFGRSDSDLLADNMVQKSRFADVGPTDDGNKP